MVPEIISFSKSLGCRLREFYTLLSHSDTPCSEVNELWASTLHDLVILRSGWLALWIVSEENCFEYNLIHPTAVIVRVDKYCFNDMCADVSVIAVQEDTNLPPELKVPLIELHPIKKQEFDLSDLKIIANWLDKSRFFFKYLWYPWDAKENVKLSDWCSAHLEDRLKIQSDIQNGICERKVAHYYKSLVREAWEIEISLNEHYPGELSKSERISIINKCIRKKIIKLELAFFEAQESRNDLIALRLKKHFVREKKVAKFVWTGGDVDVLITYLNLAKLQLLEEVTMEVSPSFQEALDSSDPDEIILLSPGSHSLRSLNNLQLGGTICGVEEPSTTEVSCEGSGVKKAILFELFGDFSFKNIKIKQPAGIAIQISGRTLKISNCHLVGRKNRGTRGIVVLSGSILILESCIIEGFGVGIAVGKGARVSINDCLVHDCLGGIKVTNQTEISIRNTEVSDCTEYAIRLESNKNDPNLPLTGELDLLRSYYGNRSHLEIESVLLKDNVKCNVLITRNLEDLNPCVLDTDFFNESNSRSDDNLSD